MSTPPIETVDGVRGILVKIGLGEPASRAFVAAAVVGVTAYAFKLPTASFDEEGEMRPFKATSRSPHATYTHFLAVPLVAAATAFVFT